MLPKRSMACLAILLVALVPSALVAQAARADVVSARDMTEAQYVQRIPPVFRELYGPVATPAATLLWHNAGPVFAVDAMTRAYGEIWALQGPLSLNERSVATVAALVAQRLYPQIKLHINGFLSSGGTLDALFVLVGSMARESVSSIPEALVDAVTAGLQWRAASMQGFRAPSKDEVSRALSTAVRDDMSPLNQRMSLLAKLSAHIALGDIPKIHDVMLAFVHTIPANANKDQLVDLLITHLIVYCGYPRGMNAFIVWQQLRDEFALNK